MNQAFEDFWATWAEALVGRSLNRGTLKMVAEGAWHAGCFVGRMASAEESAQTPADKAISYGYVRDLIADLRKGPQWGTSVVMLKAANELERLLTRRTGEE